MENSPGRYRLENEQPKPTEQPKQPEQTQPRQGRAEGRESLQGPTTVDRSEQPNFQPGSTLSQAVERTRVLYERNGWVFLPFGEAGQGNVSSANTGETESLEAGLKDKSPVIEPPKRRWRVGSACSGIRVYDEDESPRISENKNS